MKKEFRREELDFGRLSQLFFSSSNELTLWRQKVFQEKVPEK